MSATCEIAEKLNRQEEASTRISIDTNTFATTRAMNDVTPQKSVSWAVLGGLLHNRPLIARRM